VDVEEEEGTGTALLSLEDDIDMVNVEEKEIEADEEEVEVTDGAIIDGEKEGGYVPVVVALGEDVPVPVEEADEVKEGCMKGEASGVTEGVPDVLDDSDMVGDGRRDIETDGVEVLEGNIDGVHVGLPITYATCAKGSVT
jgi:hypothetical protein